jgi:hypothetical protein
MTSSVGRLGVFGRLLYDRNALTVGVEVASIIGISLSVRDAGAIEKWS